MEKKPPEKPKPPAISSELRTTELPSTTLPPTPEVTPEAKPEEKPPEEKPEDAELKSKELMLKMGFSFAGSTMETLTNDPEMNLSDVELNSLIEVWKPFIPEMPPWVCAAIITGVVFGKRGILLYHKRKKKPKEKPEEKPEVKPEEKPERKPEEKPEGKPSLDGL